MVKHLKTKLIKAILSITAVACLSVTAFQFTDREANVAQIEKYMVDPGPGGG